jgi:predicted nuclease with RNAse H fold
LRSLGIDVSVRRGLDVAALDESRHLVAVRSHQRVDDLPALLRELAPDVVAIDSPPAWGRAGRSRRAERDLRCLGLSSYATPSDPVWRERPFYAWMKVGFAVFRRVAASGFGRFRSGGVRRTAIEVFPYATAVALTGMLRPPGTSKRSWRREVLRRQGLDVDRLPTLDAIDAALAALTGLLALQGRVTAVGDPREGVIVLPLEVLPGRPYEARER